MIYSYYTIYSYHLHHCPWDNGSFNIWLVDMDLFLVTPRVSLLLNIDRFYPYNLGCLRSVNHELWMCRSALLSDNEQYIFASFFEEIPRVEMLIWAAWPIKLCLLVILGKGILLNLRSRLLNQDTMYYFGFTCRYEHIVSIYINQLYLVKIYLGNSSQRIAHHHILWQYFQLFIRYLGSYLLTWFNFIPCMGR